MRTPGAFRSRALVGLLTAAFALLGPGIASADHFDDKADTGIFNPHLEVTPGYSVADTRSSLSLRVTQNDHENVIDRYQVQLPGWRLTAANITHAAVDTCKDLSSFTPLDQAERIGYAFMKVATGHDCTTDPTTCGTTSDGTRDPRTAFSTNQPPKQYQPGPVEYSGELYFLSWNPATSTAVLCGRISYADAAADPRWPWSINTVVFQVEAVYGNGAWTLSWNYSAAPGDTAGNRSLNDNPDFQTRNGSILSTKLVLNDVTWGNYNTEPNGTRKAQAVYSQTPIQPGTYRFEGTFTQCDPATANPCKANGLSAVRDVDVNFSGFPSGFHPFATIVTPQLYSIITGGAPVPLKWSAPPPSGKLHRVKGYVLIVAHPDPLPNDTQNYHGRYVVTDPTDPAYDANLDPCAADQFGGVTCDQSLEFPLRTPGGSLSAEGLYSASIVTLFGDGHRSDGRCDDGSLLGVQAPCGDGTVPAKLGPGYASTEFLLRPDAWPLIYRDLSKIGWLDGAFVRVLLVNFMTMRYEFIIWHIQGLVTVYSRPTTLVRGDNAVGGSVTDLSADALFGIQAVVTSSSVRGLYVLSNVNDRSKTQATNFDAQRA